MSLEEKVGGWIDRARQYISTKPEDMVAYLRDRKLKTYFQNLPEEERRERESLLTRYVGESVQKYDSDLHGTRKLISKSTMAAAVVNDIYSLISKAPFANFSAVSYVLFGAKTLFELPAMRRYLKKSHDWYGAALWALMKPVNYILPIIGPMIESGSFDRMVKRRVMYEAQNRFLEHIGAYSEKVKARKALKTPIRELLSPGFTSNEELPAYASA